MEIGPGVSTFLNSFLIAEKYSKILEEEELINDNRRGEMLQQHEEIDELSAAQKTLTESLRKSEAHMEEMKNLAKMYLGQVCDVVLLKCYIC